jgi:hypothetical protein
MFQCTDIRVQWNPAVKATCWGQKTLQSLSYTNVALNITTDILFAVIIPALMLWGLNMNRRTKMSLLAVLGLGVFVCAAAIIKVGYLVNYGKTGDWLWDSRNITIWTVVECNMGIMAGSLPTLKPVLKRVLGSTYGSGSRKTPTAANYYAGGTRKSGSHWTALGSRRDGVTDETSSERAFNRGVGQSYELDENIISPSAKTTTKVTVSADVESKSSTSSLDDISAIPGGTSGATAGSGPGGIRKTTTTTMAYQNKS